MNKSTFLSILLLVFSMFAWQLPASSQALLDENFTSAVGTTLTANGWTAHSSGGTNAITVTAPSISYAGYLSSGIGNEVVVNSSGEDINHSFASQTSGNVYVSCLINVTAANLAGDYFLHFGQSVIGTAFRARFFVKKDASDNLAFGISQSSSTVNYTPFTYALNTTYLVVLRYSIVSGTTNDVSAFYINPVLNATEPATGWISNTDASGADLTDVACVALRQGSAANAATVKVDGLRVATNWADIVGSSAAAPVWTAGWPKAENAISSGFTAKVNIDIPGTSYFVVLASGASAPTSAQVKAGQDATGTALAANLKGTIACAAGNTEYTSNATGLTASTAYDVYFVAEDISATLQATPVLVSVSTTASGTAPVVVNPSSGSVTSTSAVLGGEITSDGGSAITERGTVWKTTAGVTIADNKLIEGGTATGTFTHSRTGLPSGVQIFYKAYATNGVGTTLSSENSFYTLSPDLTAHVIGFTGAAASSTSVLLSWTTPSPGAYGYIILQKAGAVAPTGLPQDGVAYSPGDVIGDGTVAAIATPGTALATAILGYSPATQYSFTIIPFNYSGFSSQTFNYYTDPVIPSATVTTDTPPASTYTWTGADLGLWTDPANWTPNRTTPAYNDILQFSDGTTKTVTGLVTETIGKLVLSNNSVVNLQSSAAATLSISGGPGADFDVPSGCSFNLNAINAISVSLATGTTGSVSGSVTYSSTASTAHRLLAADAGAMVFHNGGSFTAGAFFSGNAFGTTNLNSVVFESGSKYIAQAGSNPFGASQPSSVVVFQTGSLYKIIANLTPSLSGRTYSNLEVDFATATLTSTGGFASSIDNLTITNGTMNFNMTGTPGHSIKGNITVGSGATLNFAPASAGTVNLNGSSQQSITNNGTLTFGANSTIAVNNAAGVVLNNNVTLNHAVLTSGIVQTNASTLTVNGTLTGASTASYVDGNLARPFATAASKDFAIGKGGNYRPVTVNFTALDAPAVVTASQSETAISGTPLPGTTLFTDRHWTISQTGATTFAYDITLDGTGFTPANTPVIVKSDAGTHTNHTTTGTAPAYTTSGLTSFSDFAIASYLAPPVITSSPATLSNFDYIVGNGPSAEQTFSVSGNDLTADIIITAPANYEISTTSGAGFASVINLTPASGSVANTTIYTRLKAGLAAGSYLGEVISITSTGAALHTVTCGGTVSNPILTAGTLNAFGAVCISTTAGPESFSLTGSELSTANVAVGPLSGYTFATSAGGTYTPSLSITQPGGAFSATIYVKFSPSAVQSYNGNIPVSGGAAPAISVVASGSGINTLPSVSTTNPATLITATSATCDGNVSDAGCSAVTERGICYGTALNPDLSGSKVSVTGTTGAFSALLSALEPNTTYHYRAYAVSASGTAYGADFTFITLTTMPVVVTQAATSVTSATADLNGMVTAGNSATSVTFEYGTTVAYGNTVAANPATVNGNTATPVVYSLSGLSPNTTYHFRAVATNIAGTTNGADFTFTTAAVLPIVTTDAASLLTAVSATLNGTVNANNASTTVAFEYGTTTAYGLTVSAVPNPVTGSVSTSISAALSNLIPNTTYHYRAIGTNAAGTAQGADLTFTTLTLPPVAITEAATAVVLTEATLNGTVNANNQTATVTFDYGLTAAYGLTANATPGTVTGYSNTPVSAALSGLNVNSEYHYRVVAVNASGTTYGADMTFTTNCFPPEAAGAITGPASVCVNATNVVYATAPIANATSYVWSLPAGAVIASGNGTNTITVNFGATPVNGNISVYGSSACGNGASSEVAVSVSGYPVPVINGQPNACIGFTNNTYSTETGMTAYSWTVSTGGTITAGQGTQAITVTWNTTGAKTVGVSYTNATGCPAQTPTVFNVVVNGVPTPTVSGTSATCAGTSGLVYTTEAGYSNYMWTVSYGGMITSGVNTNQVTVTWQTAGTRTITANYSNSNGCSAPDPATLSVNVSTAPDPEIYGDNDVCQGSTAVEYSTEPGFENYVWLVSPGGVIASGAGTNTITVNWNTPGNHNVSVNYTNATGCSASQPSLFPVTVQPKPAAAGVITGPASVCSGSTGLSYSIEPVANALSYTWILPAGINITSGVGTNNITVTITSAATSGSIKVYANNYCGSGTLSPGFNLTVKPAPATPVITQHGDTLSSSATAGNQWYLDGVEIAGATLQQCVAVYAGNYTVIVTLDGCSSQPSEAIFVQPVGIKNVIINGFDIFPNPSNGKFTIEAVTTLTGDYTLEVYNTNGKLMLKEQTRISDATTRIPVDLGFVPNGVYQVVLRNATGTLTRKVLIMH